jgi:membrane associated rhomboid family serine protease
VGDTESPAALRQALVTFGPPVLWGAGSVLWWSTGSSPGVIRGLPAYLLVGPALHLNLAHLAVNTVIWVLAARSLLVTVPAWRVLTVGAAGTVAGVLSFELLSGDTVPVIGASAGVFALLAFLVTLWPPNPTVVWKYAAAAWCALEVLTSLGTLAAVTAAVPAGVASTAAGASAAAHVGGVLTGVAAGCAQRSANRWRPTQP